MIDEPRKRGLGRGLSALLDDEAAGDHATPEPRAGTTGVNIDRLKPNPLQPRRNFAETEIENLAESIRASGILQPILVRRAPEGGGDYEIVAGERRWRAAQRVRLHEVPILIRDLSDAETLELALVENIQREDLTPIEEAEGYRRLIDQHGQTRDGIAAMVGKSRSHVANTLRLLSLPDEVRRLLDQGRLSPGQARPLIGLEQAAAMAARVVAKGMSARQVERLAQRTKKAGEGAPAGTGWAEEAKSADTRALERQLGELLGLVVAINHKGEAGEIHIRYRSLEQLDDICQRLGRAQE